MALTLSAAPAGADLIEGGDGIRGDTALEASRQIAGQVTTLLGSESWALDALREGRASRRTRRARVLERIRGESSSDGEVRIGEDGTVSPDIEGGTDSVLDLGADALFAELEGSKEEVDPLDLAALFAGMGLSEDEIAGLMADVPELAVIMADYMIAFSDGTMLIAFNLGKLFAGKPLIDWSKLFKRRRFLQSTRERAQANRAERRGTVADEEEDIEDQAKKIRKVVRSVFKIICGVGIGLIFLLIVRML